MNCPYCGSRTHQDWLTCGEGETWVCGGALPEVDQLPYNQDKWVAIFEDCEAVTLDTRGYTVQSVKVTRPGIPAKTFNQHIREMNSAVDNMKAEMGEAFLPVFERILKVAQPIATRVTK